MLESMSGDPTEPVVGEQAVVGMAVEFGGDEVGGHAVGEAVDHLGKVLLGHVRRTGIDVHHLDAGFDLDGTRGGLVGPADEHRGLTARLGQGRDQFTHVDVHATAVT